MIAIHMGNLRSHHDLDRAEAEAPRAHPQAWAAAVDRAGRVVCALVNEVPIEVIRLYDDANDDDGDDDAQIVSDHRDAVVLIALKLLEQGGHMTSHEAKAFFDVGNDLP